MSLLGGRGFQIANQLVPSGNQLAVQALRGFLANQQRRRQEDERRRERKRQEEQQKKAEKKAKRRRNVGLAVDLSLTAGATSLGAFGAEANPLKETADLSKVEILPGEQELASAARFTPNPQSTALSGTSLGTPFGQAEGVGGSVSQNATGTGVSNPFVLSANGPAPDAAFDPSAFSRARTGTGFTTPGFDQSVSQRLPQIGTDPKFGELGTQSGLRPASAQPQVPMGFDPRVAQARTPPPQAPGRAGFGTDASGRSFVERLGGNLIYGLANRFSPGAAAILQNQPQFNPQLRIQQQRLGLQQRGVDLQERGLEQRGAFQDATLGLRRQRNTDLFNQGQETLGISRGNLLERQRGNTFRSNEDRRAEEVFRDKQATKLTPEQISQDRGLEINLKQARIDNLNQRGAKGGSRGGGVTFPSLSSLFQSGGMTKEQFVAQVKERYGFDVTPQGESFSPGQIGQMAVLGVAPARLNFLLEKLLSDRNVPSASSILFNNIADAQDQGGGNELDIVGAFIKEGGDTETARQALIQLGHDDQQAQDFIDEQVGFRKEILEKRRLNQ